jgi:hypothetical protein
MTSVRPEGELRSSVAVKRFPFSDEWMARFRFARGYLIQRVSGSAGLT